MSMKNRAMQATLSVNLGEAENPSSEGAMAKRKGSEAEIFCKKPLKTDQKATAYLYRM